MELRVRVEVKKEETVLGGVESRNIKGRKERRVRGYGSHGLRDVAVDATIQFPWVGKES